MDPVATLKELRALWLSLGALLERVQAWISGDQPGRTTAQLNEGVSLLDELADQAGRFGELWSALDDWLKNGGFSPWPAGPELIDFADGEVAEGRFRIAYPSSLNPSAFDVPAAIHRVRVMVPDGELIIVAVPPGTAAVIANKVHAAIARVERESGPRPRQLDGLHEIDLSPEQVRVLHAGVLQGGRAGVVKLSLCEEEADDRGEYDLHDGELYVLQGEHRELIERDGKRRVMA
jgi:hypothetical protein